MRRLAAQGLALMALPLLAVGCLKPTREELRAQYHKRDAILSERIFAARFQGKRPQMVRVLRPATYVVHLLEIDGARIPPKWLYLLDQSRFTSYHPSNFAYLPDGAESLRLRYTITRQMEASTYEVDWQLTVPVADIQYEVRSGGRLLTYPFWGLPRDLADVPFTAARRLGFAHSGGPYSDDPADRIVDLGNFALGAVGASWLVLLTVSPPAVSIPIAIIFAGPMGGYIAMNSSVSPASPLINGTRRLCDAVQVPLLRDGIDSEDWFPNCKFGAMRPVVTYGEGPRMWRAVSVKRIRTP